MNTPSMIDLLSEGSQRDTIVALPTLSHALHWWPRIADMFIDSHGKPHVFVAKTGLASNRTHTVVRLWVRYEREPTMPMDFAILRSNFNLLNLYGMC